jgi:serine/threonine protein kinase/outer membrane protein assembly factor BamB
MEALTAADPRTIGEFRLRARLGAGGMGQVFLASSLSGRMVAVKVIHADLGRDPEFIRRFRGEVSAAARVSGIYTAPVVAAGLDDMPLWLATAFVPGPSLDDIVSRHGPLPVPALWRLAGGLAEALRAIHATGLVHRDLKPANVLLASDGPRVIDFGIARALTESRLTATGSVIGTPGYMSPEQVEGLECGPPSDVFSLGSVLAFAADGTAPFNGGPGRSSASVMYRVVHAEPDLSLVPGDARELIAACLAKDPRYRPDLGQVAAHCAAMADHLDMPAAAFWPHDVAQVIEARQAAVATELQALQATPAPQAPQAPQAQQVAQARPIPQPSQAQPWPWPDARMNTSPSRRAVAQPPTGPSGAGDWGRSPFPGIGPGGRSGGTQRQGMSRRGLIMGAGVAGVAVVGGVTSWLLARESVGPHPAGYESPQSGGTGTGTGASPPTGAGTGASASGGSGSPSSAWTFSTGNAVEATPGVGNGVVYVGCKDNYVYAVDIATGKQAWKCQVGWVTAAPVLVGDTVCVATTTGGFYAIHAASGVIAWQQRTIPAGAWKQPWAIDGGHVILPLSVTQPLQAFDAATGLRGKSYGSGGQYSATIAAADGVLYAFDEFGGLHAMATSTGAEIWNSQVVGSGDTPGTGLVISGGAIYVGTDTGTLYSLNAATGHQNWSYQTGDTLTTNPAVGDGLVYFNDDSGNLYAITVTDGKQAWKGSAATGGASAPVVAGGRVYVSTDFALQALDAKSGGAIWSYSPPSGGLVTTAAVAGGLIFVGSSSDNLYAIRA